MPYLGLPELRAVARSQGWSVRLTKNSHWCFVPPDPSHPKAYTGSTPSDRRALINFRRDLRRMGLRI